MLTKTRPGMWALALVMIAANAVYAAPRASGKTSSPYPAVIGPPYRASTYTGDGFCGENAEQQTEDDLETLLAGEGRATCTEEYGHNLSTGKGHASARVVRSGGGFSEGFAAAATGFGGTASLWKPAVGQAFDVTFEFTLESASIDAGSTEARVELRFEATDSATGTQVSLSEIVAEETLTPVAPTAKRSVTLTLRPPADRALGQIFALASLNSFAWESGLLLPGLTTGSGARGSFVLHGIKIAPWTPDP